MDSAITWSLILSFENAADVPRLRLVSRFFNGLIQDPQAWYSTVLLLTDAVVKRHIHSISDYWKFLLWAGQLKFLRWIQVAGEKEVTLDEVFMAASLLYLYLKRIKKAEGLNPSLQLETRHLYRLSKGVYWDPAVPCYSAFCWVNNGFRIQSGGLKLEALLHLDVIRDLESLAIGPDTLARCLRLSAPTQTLVLSPSLRGDELVILDSVSVPSLAVVLDVRDADIYIAFQNWGDKWCEWLSKTSKRILHHTPPTMHQRHYSFGFPDLRSLGRLESLHIDSTSFTNYSYLKYTCLPTLRHLSIWNSHGLLEDPNLTTAFPTSRNCPLRNMDITGVVACAGPRSTCPTCPGGNR